MLMQVVFVGFPAGWDLTFEVNGKRLKPIGFRRPMASVLLVFVGLFNLQCHTASD